MIRGACGLFSLACDDTGVGWQQYFDKLSTRGRGAGSDGAALGCESLRGPIDVNYASGNGLANARFGHVGNADHIVQ